MEETSFGRQLKNIRKSASITQEELAEMLNIHVQTVSKWERDVSEPDISLLSEISSCLNVTLEQLVGVREEGGVTGGVFDISSLGAKIRELRQAAGEGQKTLAKAMSVSSDTVSKWERCKVCPNIESLKKLSSHYAVSFSGLYYATCEYERVEGGAPAIPPKKRGLKLIITAASFLLAAAVALSAYFIAPRHVHAFGEWQIEHITDCREGGVEVRKCSGCGEEEHRDISPGEHQIITVYGKPPTCTENGTSDGRVCSVCGKVFSPQELLPLLGHNVSDWIETEAGLRVKECTRCGKILRSVNLLA